MTSGPEIEGLTPKSEQKRELHKRPGPTPGRPAGYVRPPIAAATEETVRPQMRVDSVREAEEYARQVIENLGDSFEQTDEFYVDHNVIPDGWAYEWKRVSVAGQLDEHYMTGLLRQGWRAVPASRHPEMMPAGAKGAIQKKGLQLMEWPKVLTTRALKRQSAEAKDVLKNSEKALYDTPASTASRDEYPDQLKYVRREMLSTRDSDAET
jgi:hypothetical protein